MGTDRSVVKKSASGHRLPMSGVSIVTFASVAVAVILLAAMAGSQWWAFRTQRKHSETAEAEKTRAVGDSLARMAEALLAANEISTLRRLVSEVGASQNLDSCRVVLPDGQIVADAAPGHINVLRIPDSWPGLSGALEESSGHGKILLSFPLDVLGRGEARLEITALTDRPPGTQLGTQTGLRVIAGLAFLAMLLVYRYARPSFKAIGAIRRALLEQESGEESQTTLGISPEFGPEACAWNKLLEEKESLEKRVFLEQASQSLKSKRSANSNLGNACDVLPQGLILVDSSQQISYANGAAAVFLQNERDEIVGEDLSKFIKDEQILEPIQCAIAGGTFKRTIVELEQDGPAGKAILRLIIRPVRREDSGIAMIIVEDITQQRVAEEARNTFLAQATHELRAPLTNIRLYVETALAEGEKDPAMRNNCLNIINEESTRLERIVSDILSVSEIEAGSFQIRRDDVRFEVLLEQLKTDYEQQAKEKQIELTFELPPKLPVLQGDRDKIVLALHNLIGNALKYTPTDGKVTVGITVSRCQVAIDVSDTGMGISEGEVDKVFEKFYRAKNAKVANITGSGMGLALAREVIRLHGGDIEVRSELDRGSTFTLTLPMIEEAA